LESLQGRDNWEGLGVDGNIVVKYISEIGWGDVELVGVAQDRNGWRAVVSTLMSLYVPHEALNFLAS
jgi:hypothetical protein